MNTASDHPTIVLWIEDNLPLVKNRTLLLEKLLVKYGCTLEVRSNLAAGREFLEQNAVRVAAVILDLDIPETADSVGHSGEAIRPTGLHLLDAFGWLPFIVFSGHSELESQFPHPLPTPLAWLEKGGDPEELGRYLGHVLELESASRDAAKLAEDPVNRELRTLVCVRFHLQSFGVPLTTGLPRVPWETFSLLQADDLAKECILNYQGRYIGWAGCNLFFEFPGAGADPDHLQSAISAVTELWQRSHGPRGDRLRWNDWFIPPFSAGFLPNHVNLAERLRPNQPALHAMGRPGEVVANIARELKPGDMGLVDSWLTPGSRSADAFNRVGTPLSHVLAVLPYSAAAVRLGFKPIPNSPSHT